jgi:hypothetical protein
LFGLGLRDCQVIVIYDPVSSEVAAIGVFSVTAKVVLSIEFFQQFLRLSSRPVVSCEIIITVEHA